MSKTWVTRFDEELVTNAKRFLQASAQHPVSQAALEKHGYTEDERERGRTLVRDSERAFEWERAGRAWNFLSDTPRGRRAEADDWFEDTRRRFRRACFKRAEKTIISMIDERAWFDPFRAASVVRDVVTVLSPRQYLAHRAEWKRDREAALGERPEGAPPAKDTVLVELNGWYERWRLLAQRVFRGRDDLLAPFGLVSGKAPPRLRGKAAQKYGEGAAKSLPRVDADGLTRLPLVD